MARKTKKQRGAALTMVSLSVVGLCGIAALTVDEGFIWSAKQRAQNIADAAVLAAAQSLTTSAGSNTSAIAAATKVINANNAVTQSSFKPNAVDSGKSTYVTFPTNITADDGTVFSPAPGRAVRVDGYINAPAAFGRVVGFSPISKDGVGGQTSVPAHAIALIENLVYTYNAVPFGPVGDQPDSSDPDLSYLGQLLQTPPTYGAYQTKNVILKADSNGGSSNKAAGNFGAIDLPGSKGADDYRKNIAGPSNAKIYVGEVIDTETGNMVGPTQQGMSDRLSSSNTSYTHYFNSYDEWFFGRSTDPSTGKPFPAADPPTVTTADGITHNVYQDPQKQNSTDAHLAVVPFVSSPSKNGKAQVTVLGFGVFFIDNSTPSGSDAVVQGRFIGMAVKGHGVPGDGTPSGGAYAISLVQ